MFELLFVAWASITLVVSHLSPAIKPVDTMPGSDLIVEDYPISTFLIDCWLFMNQPAVWLRTKMFLSTSLLIIPFIFITLFLFNLVPIILSGVLIWTFGVVPLITFSWTVIVACCASISFLSVYSHLLFGRILTIFFEETVRVRPETIDVMRKYNSSFTLKISESYKFIDPPIVFIRKRGLNKADLLKDPKDEEMPLILAAQFVLLYCPVPRQGLSSFALSIFTLLVILNTFFFKLIKAAVLRLKYISLMLLCCLMVAIFGSPATVQFWLDLAWDVLTFLLFGVTSLFTNFKQFRYLLRLLFLFIYLRLNKILLQVTLNVDGHAGPVRGFDTKEEKFAQIWNAGVARLQTFVDTVSLPNFIRTLPERFDIEAINESQRILHDLGWPDSDPVVSGPETKTMNWEQYKHAYLGTVPSIKQGIHRVEYEIKTDTEALSALGPAWIRSESYATVENELASLARYFEEPTRKDFDLPIDEIWLLVHSIFENSRLTSYREILRHWNKKYGLGPFWRKTKSKKWRKMSRNDFIKALGGFENLLKLWVETLKHAPGLVPVAPVSVKGEALPEKKFLADKLRTVIGSPIVHYIMSTVWNYFPNHNFRYWSTSIKVGMPLNGANLSQLVTEHLAFDKHFAGDFTAFDSTVTEPMVKIIKKVRKKGFEYHRDYAKICFLIDSNYEALLKMPLLTTSTGNLYDKKVGLSTGHSSTSMDNSVAVLAFYLLAWKHLTGLSAHEFRYFVKVSLYADDHIMSYRATAPAAWHPKNIIAALRNFNVTMRDEEESHDLMKMSFLSKFWRRPTTSDQLELKQAGVHPPSLIVYHDPSRLVGKACAPARRAYGDKHYRAKRLISYMDLCAHHKDIYDKLLIDVKALLKQKDGTEMKIYHTIPTYEQVLQKWYNEKSVYKEEDTDDPETADVKGDVLTYTSSLGLDTLVHVLSVLPDIANPAIYNMGYTNYLVSVFGKFLLWPIELIKRSNGANTPAFITQLLKRTCYDFLADVPTLLVGDSNLHTSEILTRHWLFILFKGEDWKPNVAKVTSYLDKQISLLNFMATGYVSTYIRRYDFPVFQILLVVLLSYVPGLPFADKAMYFRVPTASAVVEYLWGYALKVFWSTIPANMKEVSAALTTMDSNPYVLVVAPTGTGKSTTFVSYVYRNFGYLYPRVVLVLPRRILVESLTSYLRSNYGLPAFAVTAGVQAPRDARLIITTAAEVFLHENWLTEHSLFLVDEAHVNEPLTIGVSRMLTSSRAHTIFLTATPSPYIREIVNIEIPLTIASVWSIVNVAFQVVQATAESDVHFFWANYRSRVLGIVKKQRISKFLIFCPTVKQCAELATRMEGRACVLTSKSRYVDPTAQFFIATSVADVGLTIPDVDWVITSNVTMASLPDSSVPSFVWVDPLLERQRKGRAGRTKNGIFTMITFKDLPFVKTNSTWATWQIGKALLLSGVPAIQVSRWYPETYGKLIGKDAYEREDDEVIDMMVTSISNAQNVLNTRGYVPITFTDSEDKSYFTVMGNTLSGIKEVDMGGNETVPQPVSDHELMRFIVGGTLEAICDNKTISERDWYGIFRLAGISYEDFKAWYTRFSVMTDAQIEAAIDSRGEPSARFSRTGTNSYYRFMEGITTEGALAAFNYWDKPLVPDYGD
jgi:lambda repressor-like predicted transcriptional regulator